MRAPKRLGFSLTSCVVIVLAGALAASCSSGPGLTAAQRKAVAGILPVPRSSTSIVGTTSSIPTPVTLPVGVAVPNVIGMYPPQAKSVLLAARLRIVSVNVACNHGYVQSQSVVASLALGGTNPPQVLSSGTLVPKHSFIDITWSGCWGKGTAVPTVIGEGYRVAVQTLRRAGLQTLCISAVPGKKPGGAVSAQSPLGGTVVTAGTVVNVTVTTCPIHP